MNRPGGGPPALPACRSGGSRTAPTRGQRPDSCDRDAGGYFPPTFPAPVLYFDIPGVGCALEKGAGPRADLGQR